MPVQMLEHYTIRCADLEATRDFYSAVLGLAVGPRPNFPFRGYWLYGGGVPIVHLVDRSESEARGGGKTGAQTSPLDHIAFRSADFEAMRALLQARGISFRESGAADFRIRQIFLRDPEGILVELNFRQAAPA